MITARKPLNTDDLLAFPDDGNRHELVHVVLRFTTDEVQTLEPVLPGFA